jgi:hypothetical protein
MEKKQGTERTRRWCFTINNPVVSAEELCKSVADGYQVRYIVTGEEVAPTTGTCHLQGFVEFVNPATFEQVRSRFEGAHLEPAKGSNTQNKTYCTKGGKFYEVGSCIQRMQQSEEAQQVIVLMVEDEVHPARIAIEHPELSPYVVNHFHALLAMWKEVQVVNVRTQRAEEDKQTA